MWYVIQVRTGTEENIRIQCEKRIPSHILEKCYIPYYERMRRYEGAWHKEQKILFPGYLFLISDQLERLYPGLKNVIGLTKLIGTGREIVPLTEEETKLIRKLAGEDIQRRHTGRKDRHHRRTFKRPGRLYPESGPSQTCGVA